MSIREILDRLNKMDRKEFRKKMNKAILADFFRTITKKEKPCKLTPQKQE